MPKVRALKPMFHNGSFRAIGSVFDVSDTTVELARARIKAKGADKTYRPTFELVPVKAPPKAADDLV